MNIYYALSHGTTFYVERATPFYVWNEDDNAHFIISNRRSYLMGGFECGKSSCPYCADVCMTHSSTQLIFKILDTGKHSLIEIDGYDTFVFDLRPHTESEEGEVKGYDYRPQKDYGLHDYEKYDGCGLYPTIKCLIIDLIESSLKSNSDNEV